MTHSPAKRQSNARKGNRQLTLSSQEIEDRLQKAGVQPTLQRISLFLHLVNDADHPTAEQVHEWSVQNGTKISLATVYNTLNTLVAAGLLMEFRFPHSDKVIYDSNIGDHHHFFDIETKQLFDVSPEDVQIKTDLQKKFKVTQTNVLLKGHIRK